MAKNLRDTAIREFRQRYAAFCCVLFLVLAIIGFAVDGVASWSSYEGDGQCQINDEATRCDVEPIVGKEDIKEYQSILKTLDIPRK